MAYADMPPEASNQVSGLTNLMRNMGGSIGISAVTTLVARREQVHQAYLSRDTFQFEPGLQQRLPQIADFLTQRNGAQGFQQGYGELYRLVQRLATVLDYIDTFRVMTAICILAMPLILLAKRNKPGQAPAGH